MINKITFKNYKSFKDKQTLELKPITVIIGKNSSGKSSILKLTSVIESSLQMDSDSPIKWNGFANGVELGAEFEDLIYARSKTGKLELEISDENEKLELIIGNEKGIPSIFSWKLNNIEKLGFDNKFKGFHLVTENPELKIKTLSLNTDYIGPFRVTPRREYSDADIFDEKTKVGFDGDYAYNILIQDGLTMLHPLLDKITEWFTINFEGWGIRVNKDTSPFYQIEITRDDGRINVNIKDVGQGMSQSLPLIIKALIEVKLEELICSEQPELHLHPAAHGSLAELFVKSLENSKKRYLIETHSQNFVLRLRRLVAEGKYKYFSSKDIALYYVDFDIERNISSLKPIIIDQYGDVDYWPDDVFSETLIETMAIRNAQKKSFKDAD